MDGEGDPATGAAPLSRNPLDNKSRPVKKCPLGTCRETEFHRLRHHSGELTDLQDNRAYTPAGGVLLADIHHTLGYRKLMHRSSPAELRKLPTSELATDLLDTPYYVTVSPVNINESSRRPVRNVATGNWLPYCVSD
jgi:hypothetical protein